MRFQKKFLTFTIAAAAALSLFAFPPLPARAAVPIPTSVTAPADDPIDEPYMGSSEEEISEALRDEDTSGIAVGSFGWKGTSTGAPRKEGAFQLFGLDISQYQNPTSRDENGNKVYGAIDWEQVKLSNVQFVILKIGGRKVSTGAIYMDPCFEMNVMGALEAGIPVGLYFYSGAVNPAEAIEEAEWVIEKSSPYLIQHPIFMDYEYQSTEKYPVDRLRDYGGDYNNRTATIAAFCATIERWGKRAGFYTGSYLAGKGDFDYKGLSKAYMAWVARYGKNDATVDMEYFPNVKNVDIWQYSSYGYIGGIPNRVDTDLWWTDGDITPLPGVTVFRLYNPVTGEHLFTTSLEELKELVTDYGWNYEAGAGWRAPETSETPVYRVYFPITGEHLYTTSELERANLILNYGWNDEGIAFYSDDNKYAPIYRLYMPEQVEFSHLYTNSFQEVYDLVYDYGWNNEDVYFYGMNTEWGN